MNTPTDSVRIVLFERGNPEQFLILTEFDDPDNWKLPGGKFLNPDETPNQAAVRELREELGLGPEDTGLEHAGRLVNDDGISARHIYSGETDLVEIEDTEGVERIMFATENKLPDTPNKAHILSAVGLARAVHQTRHSTAQG